MVLGSKSYPDHHGGMHTPLPRPLTIAEKGVDVGWVIGGHTTGDNWAENKDLDAHTPQLGTGYVTEYEHNCSTQNDRILSEHTPDLRTQADLDISPVIDCVHLRTAVQPASPATDLRKVEYGQASPNLDVNVEVGVRGETFSDIGGMIARWEMMENSENEWKVEEGVRRGGRKLSRRISELLGNFEQREEGERVDDLETDVDLEGGKPNVMTNLSLVATKSTKTAPSVTNKFGFSSLKLPNYCSKPRTKLKKNVIQSGLGGESRILSEGCDWLSAIPSYNLTANERPAGAQKRKDGGESSKQRVAKKMRGFGPNL